MMSRMCEREEGSVFWPSAALAHDSSRVYNDALRNGGISSARESQAFGAFLPFVFSTHPCIIQT